MMKIQENPNKFVGTHGVEGYSGVSVAIDWLRHYAPRWSARDIGVLCVHALNPYGFAWDRRVTHEGCDLNRNFMDFPAPPHNERYAEIAELLLPSSLDPHCIKQAEDELTRWQERHGEQAFQIARKSGQRTDPKRDVLHGERTKRGTRVGAPRQQTAGRRGKPKDP
jgi:predicted deacylase